MPSLKNKIKEFVHTASGLLVPNDKPKGYQCGFCPTVIFLHNEVRGMLHTASGVPICAKCRILRQSKMSKKILADKKNFLKDQAELEHRVQVRANETVMELAHASQMKHKDAMITK